MNTGSFYTIIDSNLANRLKIKAVMEVILADRRKVKAGLTVAYMRILDREGGLPMAIMDVPEPLLGITALEGLSLKVNNTPGRNHTLCVGKLNDAFYDSSYKGMH